MNSGDREKLKQGIQNKYYRGKNCVVLWREIIPGKWEYDYCPKGEYEKSFIITFGPGFNLIKREEIL